MTGAGATAIMMIRVYSGCALFLQSASGNAALLQPPRAFLKLVMIIHFVSVSILSGSKVEITHGLLARC